MCSLNTPVDAPPVSDAENVSASAPGTLQSLTYINFRSRASAVLHDHADVQRLDRTRAHLSCASRGNHKSRSRRRTHTHRGRIRKPRHRDLDLRTALLRVLPANRSGTFSETPQLFGDMVPVEGIEPTLLAEHDFESCASTSSATPAWLYL